MLHQPLSVPPAPPLSVEAADQSEMPAGTRLLQGQYQIEQSLIAGGFGITYLARDSLDRRVVIKECYPSEICDRVAGQVRPRSPSHLRTYKAILRAFLREAHLLARSLHPNIVPVHQVFRENGTAYIAMDFIDGLDLLTLRETAAERVTPPMIESCLSQALDALSALHDQGILHRDISPDNLIWTADDRLMLIDFGAARPISQDEGNGSDDPLAVKDGYSPHELYDRNIGAQASSDLYALAATLVFLREGTPPAPGPNRLTSLSRGALDPVDLMLAEAAQDAPIWTTVARALSVVPEDRYTTAADWRMDLDRLTQARSAIPVLAHGTGDCSNDPNPSAPVPESASDPVLEPAPETGLHFRIADLVAETNDRIVAGLPRTLRAEAPAAPVAQSPKPRQMVDLFGEPITDLQRWLAEQDKPTRRDLRQARPSCVSPDDTASVSTEEAPRPSRGRGFLRLDRLFSKRTSPGQTT